MVYTKYVQGRSQKFGDGGAKNLDRKPHLLINAEQEVIIMACAFQQIIHILSNNNEQRNFDELGVTVKSLEPATLLAGASQPSRTNRAIFPDAAYIVNASMRKPMFICNPPFS